MEPAKFKAAQDEGLQLGGEVEMEEAKGRDGGLAAADALGSENTDEEQASSGGGSSSSSSNNNSSSSKLTWWSTRFAAVNRQAWLVIIM